MFTKSRFTVLAALAAVAGLSLLAAGNAQASMILNGDFSGNASSYITSPGYNSPMSSGNPANPTDWIANNKGNNSGVNGINTTTGNPFGPSSQQGNSATMDWAFLQNTTTALYQSFGVTPGQSYVVSYLDAARGGETGSALRVYVEGGGTFGPVLGSNQTTPGNVSFQKESFTFTADANLTDVIIFQNQVAGATGDTVDFTDASVAAVPEPATLGLAAAGALGLLLLKRRKAV